MKLWTLTATQLAITGPIVNATLFEQAGVPMPGPKAAWDEWAAATTKVVEATKTDFDMAMDRSGHSFAAGAISYGAKSPPASPKQPACSAVRTTSTAARPPSPAVSASASRSAARSCASPASSCSVNRSPTSTPNSASTCAAN